jgi:hypothetical protein
LFAKDLHRRPWVPEEAKGLLDDDEFFGLLNWLVVHPEVGRVIPGSGGLRKLRWAAKGHGKRGGVRVIYFGGWLMTKSSCWTFMPKGSRRT